MELKLPPFVALLPRTHAGPNQVEPIDRYPIVEAVDEEDANIILSFSNHERRYYRFEKTVPWSEADEARFAVTIGDNINVQLFTQGFGFDRRVLCVTMLARRANAAYSQTYEIPLGEWEHVARGGKSPALNAFAILEAK